MIESWFLYIRISHSPNFSVYFNDRNQVGGDEFQVVAYLNRAGVSIHENIDQLGDEIHFVSCCLLVPLIVLVGVTLCPSKLSSYRMEKRNLANQYSVV